MDLIHRIGFDHSFSFVYSARPGTPATELEDDTPESVKKERLAILQERLNQNVMQISRRMVGNVERILVTGFSPRDPGQLIRAHREQPRGQLPRPQSGRADRSLRRRGNHRGAAQLPARRTGIARLTRLGPPFRS